MKMSMPYPGPLIRSAIAIAGLAALVFLVTPTVVRADIPVAEDGFEDHDDGPTGFGWLDEWELEDNAEYSDSDDPHSGGSHMRLRGDGATARRSAEVAGESDLRLRFWGRAESLNSNDAVVEVSEDGSTFIELQRWNSDNDHGQYNFFDFDLSATGLSFLNQFWLRGRIIGGSQNNGELFLDQVELLSSSGSPAPPPNPNNTSIVVDGEFDDWSGKANITDPSGDQSGSTRRDIAAFFWANNIDQEINYHMIERHTRDGQPFDGSNGQSSWARYIVYADTNNNGNYTDGSDRRAVVTYVPTRDSSVVNVKVYPANSFTKISDSGWNDWGDSRNDGGLRVEFALDWNNLGIAFGGVIRMYSVSFSGLSIFPNITDRAPDGNADIQWSPASVLGPWLLGAASVVGISVIWFLSRRRRLWT